MTNKTVDPRRIIELQYLLLILERYPNVTIIGDANDELSSLKMKLSLPDNVRELKEFVEGRVNSLCSEYLREMLTTDLLTSYQ